MNLNDRRFLQQLGSRVRDSRIGRRLTQAQLGDACGLHRTFIGSVERGERNVAILSLRRIAAALRVPMADLMGGPIAGSAKLTCSVAVTSYGTVTPASRPDCHS